MKPRLAAISLILFALSVALWIMLTLFESSLLGMPPLVERLITLVGLVLPAAIGAVLGVTSLIRQEGRPWLALLGILLNTLFAAFHLMVVLFAG